MKKVLTTLVLAVFLSGGVVASDMRGATQPDETTISVAENTAHAASLQRNNRRRWRRRWARRRWNNRSNRRWNNRRSNNRRGRRGGGGHGGH